MAGGNTQFMADVSHQYSSYQTSRIIYCIFQFKFSASLLPTLPPSLLSMRLIKGVLCTRHLVGARCLRMNQTQEHPRMEKANLSSVKYRSTYWALLEPWAGPTRKTGFLPAQSLLLGINDYNREQWEHQSSCDEPKREEVQPGVLGQASQKRCPFSGHSGARRTLEHAWLAVTVGCPTRNESCWRTATAGGRAWVPRAQRDSGRSSFRVAARKLDFFWRLLENWAT